MGYMFRLLGAILRPSIEPNQDYLITSALRDPIALTRSPLVPTRKGLCDEKHHPKVTHLLQEQ
jgi:hypothetical protein